MTTSMKFQVPDFHPEYTEMQDVLADYKEAQVVEMVNRFIATQMTAKKSRLERAAQEKLVKAKVEAMAKAEGLTIDEFLARS